MARTPQTHPEFDHHQAKIRAAKNALATAKEAFKKEEAQRWASYSALRVAALSAALQEFAAAGANVSTLCRAYGTTDRATVLRLLPTQPTNTPATEPPTPTPQYEVTNTDPKAYTIRDEATGHTLVFDVQILPARIIGADKASQPLKNAVKADPNHPVWSLIDTVTPDLYAG